MISIIVAMTLHRVIGDQNRLPWRIPEELKNFKAITIGNVVIMGRKTFESIGKPLPDRHNIVLSKSALPIQGVEVCTSLNDALDAAESYGKEIFVIGGGEVYKQFLPIVNRMIVSYIKDDYKGDVYFPEFDLNEWKSVLRKEYPEFEVVVYERKVRNDF